MRGKINSSPLLSACLSISQTRTHVNLKREDISKIPVSERANQEEIFDTDYKLLSHSFKWYESYLRI